MPVATRQNRTTRTFCGLPQHGVLFVAGLGLFAGATIAFYRVPAGQDDLQSIIAHLVEREQQLRVGSIKFRHIDVISPIDKWQALRAGLLNSQTTQQNGMIGLTENWLVGLSAGSREVWNCSIAFDGFQWCLRRNRDEYLDTLASDLATKAQLMGTQPLPLVHSQAVWVDGQQHITLDDLRFVARRNAIGTNWPLLPIDLTLGPWEEAEGGTNVPGQTIAANLQGSCVAVEYRTIRDSYESSTIYEFCPGLDWAPSKMVTRRNETVTEERIFGYDERDGLLRRPSVSILAYSQGTENVRLSIYLIDSWNCVRDAEALNLRLPPMRLEYNDTSDTDPPVLFSVMPSFLEAVGASERLPIALSEVLTFLGTNDPERDFNADGIVDLGDLQYLMNSLAQ